MICYCNATFDISIRENDSCIRLIVKNLEMRIMKHFLIPLFGGLTGIE